MTSRSARPSIKELNLDNFQQALLVMRPIRLKLENRSCRSDSHPGEFTAVDEIDRGKDLVAGTTVVLHAETFETAG